MKLKSLLISTLIFLPVLLQAQVIKDVVINIRGSYNILIEMEGGQSVTVTQSGVIIDFNMEGEIETVSDNRLSKDSRVIRRIGDVEFEYSDQQDRLTREYPVERIGDLVFEYTNTKYRDYNTLAISKVGDLSIEYFVGDLPRRSGRAGKVKRINNVEFDYYDEEDISSSSQPNNAKSKQGLLKRIDRFTYDYFDFGTKYAGVSGYTKNIYKTIEETETVTGDDGEKKEEKVKRTVIDEISMADRARKFGAIQMRTLSSREESNYYYCRWVASSTGISGKQVIALDEIIIYVVD